MSAIRAGALVALVSACSVYDPSLLTEPPPNPSPTGGSNGGTGGSAGTDPASGGAGGTAGGSSGGSGSPGGTGGSSVVGGVGGSGDVPTGGTGGMGGNAGGDVPVTATCGDGRLAATELCDTGIAVGKTGACPQTCPPIGECLPQELVGEGCSAMCMQMPLGCEDDDDCCPTGCTYADDNDCSQSCGDGVVQSDEGETCEPDHETDPCPTDCDDGDDCTMDVLSGSEETCNAMCDHIDMGAAPDDGCCPMGANANVDNDCPSECGNGIREGDEECDGSLGCDDDCVLTVTQEQLECLELAAEDSVDPACTDCACLQCTQLAHDCLFEADTARAALCQDMIECGLVNDCAGVPCYCGPDLAICGGILGRPIGPCVYEVEDASGGTTDPLIILQRMNDISYAVGRAFALAECAVQQCADVCP